MLPQRSRSAVGNQTIFLHGSRLTDRLSSDTPEILPGELIGASASSSVSPTITASSSAPAFTSPVPTSSGSGSNTGAIAGGVAGGVVAIAAIAGLVFIFWRRRRPARAPSAAFLVNDASPPLSASPMSQVHPSPTYDHTPGPLMTLYVRCPPSYCLVLCALISCLVAVLVAVRTGPEQPEHVPPAARRRTDLHIESERSRRVVQWVLEREQSHQHAALAPAGLPWPAYCLIISHPLCDLLGRGVLSALVFLFWTL